MPALSFSSVDFVKKILEGKKTQTMRPLFKEGQKPRLKVGDKVKFYYKMMAGHPKDSWFCKKTGKITEPMVVCGEGCCVERFCDDHKPTYLADGCKCFPKMFATVEITEVVEIEMIKDPFDSRNDGIIDHGYKVCLCDRFEDFARMDGFNSVDDMFEWFHKKYDLFKNRRFVVYRWKLC